MGRLVNILFIVWEADLRILFLFFRIRSRFGLKLGSRSSCYKASDREQYFRLILAKVRLWYLVCTTICVKNFAVMLTGALIAASHFTLFSGVSVWDLAFLVSGSDSSLRFVAGSLVNLDPDPHLWRGDTIFPFGLTMKCLINYRKIL